MHTINVQRYNHVIPTIGTVRFTHDTDPEVEVRLTFDGTRVHYQATCRGNVAISTFRSRAAALDLVAGFRAINAHEIWEG